MKTQFVGNDFSTFILPKVMIEYTSTGFSVTNYKIGITGKQN